MNAWTYKNDIVALTARIEAGETVFTDYTIDAAKVADKLLEWIVLEAPKEECIGGAINHAPVADADGWKRGANEKLVWN